jgi:putative flippase GtrA
MTAPCFTNNQTKDGILAGTSPFRLRRRRWSDEFARYLLCSMLALSTDLGVFSLALQLGLSYPIAAAAGYGVGLWLAYTLSVRFAFVHRTWVDRRVEFLLFALVGLFGLLITEVLLLLLIGRVGIEAHVAKLLTAGPVFLSNYAMRKTLLFWQPFCDR